MAVVTVMWVIMSSRPAWARGLKPRERLLAVPGVKRRAPHGRVD